MIRLQWWSASEEATVRFGEVLGRALAAPAWLGLIGPLGAGKTRLVQGIAQGLGFLGRVRSPTFVLEHRHQGRAPIRHLDLYRLEAPDMDMEISWDENDESIVLVEWAERVPAPPAHAVTITITPGGENARWIGLEWPDREGPIRDLRLEDLTGFGSTPVPGPLRGITEGRR